MWILDGLKSQKNSDVLAVISRTDTMTFRELWNKSEQIAFEIEQTGKKTPVVIYGDKDSDILPTMVAALKTGRAYVPVALTYPVDRLAEIARQTDACVIFNFTDTPLDIPFEIRSKEEVALRICATPITADIGETHWVKDDDICYILFTSGSTGAPKGVPIRKRNILNYISWVNDLFAVHQAGQNILNQVSYSFDVSVNMIHVYLPLGKTLISVDKALLEDVGALVQWMQKNDISVFTSTPSFVDICRKDPSFTQEFLPKLETFNVIGEILTKQTAIFIRNHFPNAVLLNTYGPTEATVAVSGVRVTDEMIQDERPIPIGTMMPEASWYLENANGEKCSDGEIGELILIGRSVADGYFNNPERTAKSFFRTEDGRMAYRTGDNVYSDHEMLYFVGRMDSQIKLNGYRIELEDISVNLQKLPQVKRNAVLTAKDEDGKVSYIAGFVTLNEDYTGESALKSIIAIKKGLGERIPSYMIPRKIIILKEFPMNENGKIDRKALQAML